MSENDTITLYPSNWLYNASVIGFLKVAGIIYNENEIKKWVKKDGSLSIPSELVQELKEIKDEYGINKWGKFYIKASADTYNVKSNDFKEKYIFVINKRLSGQKGYYTNLITLASKDGDIAQSITALNEKINWFYYSDNSKHQVENVCSFCQTTYKVKKSDFKKFVFQNKFLSLIGGAVKNFFWNNKPSMHLCPRCSFLLIHNHLCFNKIAGGQQIFINAPSFELMWHLNNYAAYAFTSNISEVVAISLIELSQKINRTLGKWSMMNIEMIIRDKDSIDYFSLPGNTTSILLDKKISALIKATNEPYILEKILNNDFDELNHINNYILRALFNNSLTDKDLRDKNKNPILVNKFRNGSNHKRDKYQELSEILPELYVQINNMK